MKPSRAALVALFAAAVVAAAAYFAGGVPLGWAIAIGLPVGAAALVASVLSGAFDVDWSPEPDPPASGVCMHATTLADRLARAENDPYRFTSRVQPRLRRLAIEALRRKVGIDDLRDPKARELLGADLCDLLTARTAHLPPARTFTAMVRRLEEI